MYYSTTYTTPLGKVLLAADEDSLVGLWLEGQKCFGGRLLDKLVAKDDLSIFKKTKSWLDRYFAGGEPAIDELPLSPIGSVFQQSVWQILSQIPYGKVLTYGEIARKLTPVGGNGKMSAQAVGGAVGHNPISIIIPCHRVIGSGGNLTGYSGGIEAKNWLLTHEKC